MLKVPCVTLRENTDRPVAGDVGTNYLIDTEPARIMATVSDIIQDNGKQGDIPPLWNGYAGERIVQILFSTVS